MSYLTQHWSYDPFMIIVIVLVCWHEIGLARLARRSRPDRARQRRKRSLLFYGGLAVLLIAVQSPIDYWSDDYFFVHMVQHLLLMFAAPTLIVAGAPWQPLLDALPGRLGRSATREVMRAGWARPVRAAGGALLRPWVAIALFNVAMVAWHIPALFDLAENNQAVHIWLMHASFFITGILFWLQFIPSPPLRPRMSAAAQADIDEPVQPEFLVCGLQPHPWSDPAAVRRSADRCRALVGLRRLLGHPLPDRGDPPADRRGRQRGLSGRQDPWPRRPRLPLGQPVRRALAAVTAQLARAVCVPASDGGRSSRHPGRHQVQSGHRPAVIGVRRPRPGPRVTNCTDLSVP
ncbi:MAG: cytochrome c oxidase assembly protein [Streptosporangiaceae bacterium]